MPPIISITYQAIAYILTKLHEYTDPIGRYLHLFESER